MVWLGLLLLAIFATSGAGLLHLWIRPAQKRRFHEKIVELWYSLGETDPRIVVQAPIRAITRFLNAIYGEKLFSQIAFRRTTVVTLLLFGCALVVSTFESGTPFSLDDLPWRNFDRTYKAIEEVSKTTERGEEYKPEFKQLSRQLFAKIKGYNNPENRFLYSILFFPCIALSAAALNLVSIAFARQTLAEMAEAKSLVTVFSLGLGNLFIWLCIYVLGFSLVCVISSPFSWLVVWALIALGHQVSWLLAFALYVPSVIIALFLSPNWIKVLASVIVLHGTLVMLVSVGAFFLFPLRKAVRWFLLEFLDRAVSSEAGFFAFCAVFFATIGALAVEIAKVLSGRSPF